jgi:hypothetical protein
MTTIDVGYDLYMWIKGKDKLEQRSWEILELEVSLGVYRKTGLSSRLQYALYFR